MDAKTWTCRPSSLLNIRNDYVAYCVDSAIAYFGRAVEHELESVEGKTTADTAAKRRVVLDRFIGDPETPTKGLFADPGAMR